MEIILPGKLARNVREFLQASETIEVQKTTCIIQSPIALPMRGGHTEVTGGAVDLAAPDPSLVAALRRAHRMLRRDVQGQPIIDVGPASAYERKILRLAFLAPGLQQDILAGKQPRALRLETFLKCEVPLAWSAQRTALGWA